jgi:flagellin
LAKEIQRVLGGTKFNDKAILGNDAGSQTFQVGANTSSDDSIGITTTNLVNDSAITTVAGSGGSAPAGIGSAVNSAGIGTVIDNIDTAIDKINEERATLGASQNRFESVIANLQISVENQSAARGRIMDADFAAETANLSRAQILQQAGTAMISQANQQPQQVLSLLR